MTLMQDRNEKTMPIPVPINGLNTIDDETQLNILMSPNLSNVERDNYMGINKRSGFTRFNTGMLPVTFTGTISSITSQSVSGATGVVWSGIITGGLVFRMASGTNVYKISGLVSNANFTLQSDYIDTIKTGSYYISCAGIDGLYLYKYSTTQKLIAFGGGTMFNGGAGSTGEFTNLNVALKNQAKVSAVSFQDKFWFCNGYQFSVYDASTIAAVGGSPTPSDPVFVDIFTNGNANWLVYGGSKTDANKSRVSFSDVNAPETHPTANRYFAGDRDGGDVVMGKQVPGGYLIFKTNGVWIFGGVPGTSGSLRRVSNIGCPCPWSVVAHGGMVYWVGTRDGRLGVFRYMGGDTVQSIADNIEPTLASLGKSYLSSICGEIYQNKYYTSANNGSGTFNNKHFVCYINYPFQDGARVFFPWFTGTRGYNFLRTVSVSGTDYLFSASPTSGYVYQENNGITDDTTDNIFGNTSAINAYIESKCFGSADKKTELISARLNVNAVGSWYLNIDVFRDNQTYGSNTYRLDLDTNTSLWSEVIFTVTPWQTAIGKTTEEIDFLWPSIMRYFKFKWSNANASEYFTMFPMLLTYKEEAD